MWGLRGKKFPDPKGGKKGRGGGGTLGYDGGKLLLGGYGGNGGIDGGGSCFTEWIGLKGRAVGAFGVGGIFIGLALFPTLP